MNPYFLKMDPLDWSSIQPNTDTLLKQELSAGNVREWLQQWSDLEAVLEEAGGQIYREITENTVDEAADARFKQWVTEIIPSYSPVEQALKQKLLAVEDYEPTNETAQMLKRLRAEAGLFQDANVPLISELQLLGKFYSEITGGLSIVWQGEIKTIPQAEVMLSNRDRANRKQVWRLVLDEYLAQRAELDDIFLHMLPIRRQLAQNAGLDNFRSYQWQRMGRFDYTPEDCFIFHDAIEHEVVPLATELYQTIADELGLATLRPWELGVASPWVPTVDPDEQPLQPFATINELEGGANRIFNQTDPVLGGYFEAMRDGWLDLDSRPNKAPGGYCESFPVSGQPYIFMNAAGSPRNVRTLMHEGGHAFHFAEAYRQQSLVWNYHSPMEFAEVASMSMELLSIPYWTRNNGGFYGDADFKRALTEQLYGIVFFLPFMAVMDSIQHWLYAEAGDDIDAADIDHKWSELWERFLPGLDYSTLQAEKETGWHRKGHIFDVPFYYVEYGLAQLGALQVWRNALQDQGKAVADYRSALSLGYTRSLPELFKAAGATFAFDRSMVGELMALVRGKLDEVSA